MSGAGERSRRHRLRPVLSRQYNRAVVLGLTAAGRQWRLGWNDTFASVDVLRLVFGLELWFGEVAELFAVARPRYGQVLAADRLRTVGTVLVYP